MAGIDFAVYLTPEIATDIRSGADTQRKVIHRAATRSYLNEGWLQSYRTFSYSGFHDPDRMGFGKLRVLNQETMTPGAGLPCFHTGNMEIVYIPVEGAMQHYDTLGNSSVVGPHEIHVVSAGREITHGVYNANRDHLLKYLQVWVYPDRQDTQPRHCKYRLDTGSMKNCLAEIVSPRHSDTRPGINQNAWFSMGDLDRDCEVRYRVHSRQNGVYIFLMRGEAEIDGEKLRAHDGIGLSRLRCLDIRATCAARVLLIEVPVV